MNESVAIGPPKTEKLFCLLDMYEVLDDLLSEAESLFGAGFDNMILNEYREVLLQLGESAKNAFAEFKYTIQSHFIQCCSSWSNASAYKVWQTPILISQRLLWIYSQL
jgi:hypothetical protein